MSYISDELRQLVHNRANGHCEYCHMQARFAVKRHEVDHVRAEKHGGKSIEANMCLSCFECNRHKGSDLTSIDTLTGEITPLFNPRQDNWDDHFRLNGALIEPLTAVGRATVFLLQMNNEDVVDDRQTLIRSGRYP